LLLILSACACKHKNTFDEKKAREILEHFSGLASIPRQSGSCEAIGKYLKAWAEEQGCKVYTDAFGNVIADVPASEGMEELPLTALQAHMDMVCLPQNAAADFTIGDTQEVEFTLGEDGNYDANPASPEETGEAEKDIEDEYDPLTDPIDYSYKDGILVADGTSLGADNGIGIAVIMQYVSEDNPHGPLRLIFTVDAETDRGGAEGLSRSVLKDVKYFINTDSKKSNTIYYGANGESTVLAKVEDVTPVDRTHSEAIYIRVKGLKGGSTVGGIDETRLNANVVLIKMLKDLIASDIPFELVSFSGGNSGETLAQSAGASLLVEPSDLSDIWSIIKAESDRYKKWYGGIESDYECSISEDFVFGQVLSEEDSKRFVSYAYESLNGNISETASANIGVIAGSTIGFGVKNVIRCSSQDELDSLTDEQLRLAEKYGFNAQVSEFSRAWEGKSDNSLLELALSKYHELAKENARAEFNCDGMEAGSFYAKDGSMEIISIGPDIFDWHTTEEFCNMESAVRMYELIKLVLPEIK